MAYSHNNVDIDLVESYILTIEIIQMKARTRELLSTAGSSIESLVRWTSYFGHYTWSGSLSYFNCPLSYESLIVLLC